MYYNAINCVKTMACGIAKLHVKTKINSLEITLILQPACSDVKIGSACAHGNKPKTRA